MNEEIKAQWIEALLSGEYKQGKGALRNSKDEYCCLGVLCDLYSKNTGVEWGIDPLGSHNMHSNVSMTPVQVDLWGEFANGTSGTLLELAEMNDFGRTFEQIAEYIKEKL